MISLTVADGVAELVLGRAEAQNAIDWDWVSALSEATDALSDCGARALLIRAEGPAFTVGGDLGYFGAHLHDLPAEMRHMLSRYHGSLKAIATAPMPVICAAHGSVAGGGLGLLWAADEVLVAAETKFTTAFAKLGLSGDGGSSWYLPRLVGERVALRLMYDSEVLGAERALELGLISAILPAGELLAAARARAAQLAAGPTLAYATMRRLIRGAHSASLSDGLDAETDAMAQLGASADARRGIEAFIAGQRPAFSGD